MNFGGVMMALGAFRFGMSNDGYQNFARSAGYRWSEVNRIGREPAQQYAGLGSQQVTISGVIYPHFKGGLRQVDLMRAQAGLAQPLMMVDGLGWVWRRWVITHVEESKSYLMADGAPRKIEFSMTLKSYGRDTQGVTGLIGRLL